MPSSPTRTRTVYELTRGAITHPRAGGRGPCPPLPPDPHPLLTNTHTHSPQTHTWYTRGPGGRSPPHPLHSTKSRIAENRLNKFFYNFAGGRKHHPRGRDKILKKLCGASFPQSGRTCIATRCIAYIHVRHVFARKRRVCFPDFLHPPSAFPPKLFPKTHTVTYDTIHSTCMYAFAVKTQC